MAHITELRNAIRRTTQKDLNSDFACLAGFIVLDFTFLYP